MTLEQLKERTAVERISNGSYKVTITYKGKEYTTISHNSLAYDRIDTDDSETPAREVHGTYTKKGAYQHLYEKCKEDNGIY